MKNYKDCDLRKGLEFILQDLIDEEDKSYRTIENYQEKIVNWFDEKSDKNEEIKDLESEIEDLEDDLQDKSDALSSISSEIDEMKSKLDNLKNKELKETLIEIIDRIEICCN